MAIKSTTFTNPETGRVHEVEIGSKRYEEYKGRGFTPGGVSPFDTKSDADKGIQLPDKPDLPNQSGESFGGFGDIDFSSLLSKSEPSETREDIKRRTERELSGARSGIESKFGRAIEDLREEAQQQERALEGQLGTRRRFSSSAEAFIGFIDDKNNKKIADLERQKEEALANFDFKMAALIDQRAVQERQAAQQDFANAVTLFNLSKNLRQQQSEEQKQIAQSEKDSAILGAMQNGATDIADIFESVRQTRQDITLDDISSSLESMGSLAGATSGAAEKLTGDAKNFLILKQNYPETLPSHITRLPENQQLGAYMQWMEGGGAFSSGGGMSFTGSGGNIISGNGATPGTSAYDRGILTARLGKQIYGTRISDKESERVEGFITAGMAKGKSEYEIMDDVLGFNVTRNKPLAENLRNVLLSVAGEDGLAGFDMLGIARLINGGNDTQAIQRVEQTIYSRAKQLEDDSYIAESRVRTAVNQANKVSDSITEIQQRGESGFFGFGEADAPIGVVEGTMQEWLGRFRGEDATRIKSEVTSLVAELRKELLGSAVTETEERFLEGLIPKISDSPENFMVKLNQLKTDPLLRLNSMRQTYNLPALNENQLMNNNQRIGLYAQSSDPLGVFSVEPQKSQTNPMGI